MPMDRSRYPDNWKEIADAVKERAGRKCQADGCGLEHGKHIIRSPRAPERWRSVENVKFPNLRRGEKITRVILTVHHIGVDKPDGTPGDPNDKMDCRPENLIAYCQYHHLLADQANNVALSRGTRIRKKHEQQSRAGQGELFE